MAPTQAPAPETKKKRTGLIVGLSVAGAALLLLVLGFILGESIVLWIRGGYEQVPDATVDA